jgi:CRP-like cAMP-binding protein
MTALNVAEGQHIIQQGDAEATQFYIIERGSADVFVKKEGGEDIRVAQLGPGRCVGLEHWVPPEKGSRDSLLCHARTPHMTCRIPADSKARESTLRQCCCCSRLNNAEHKSDSPSQTQLQWLW